MKIRLKKVHMVPSSIIKFSRKIGCDISVQKNYANGYCFLLMLGENTVMSVSTYSTKDCHLHRHGCITMQLIVSAHANCVIESLLLKKTFNNRICMSTHNQLHYYTTISVKVTIFSTL